MKLEGLVKTVDQMTNEELIDRLREMRHNREIVRPAQRQRVEKVEKKATRAKLSAVDKLLGKLSEAEREALLAQLIPTGGGENGSNTTGDAQST